MSRSGQSKARTVRRLVRSALGGPDVRTVYRTGSRHLTTAATVHVLPGEGQRLRVAVVAGRRSGSAVSRNRARRRLREAFRDIEKDLRSGADIVIVARAGLEAVRFSTIVAALRHALEDAGMIAANTPNIPSTGLQDGI